MALILPISAIVMMKEAGWLKKLYAVYIFPQNVVFLVQENKLSSHLRSCLDCSLL